MVVNKWIIIDQYNGWNIRFLFQAENILGIFGKYNPIEMESLLRKSEEWRKTGRKEMEGTTEHIHRKERRKEGKKEGGNEGRK